MKLNISNKPDDLPETPGGGVLRGVLLRVVVALVGAAVVDAAVVVGGLVALDRPEGSILISAHW